MHSDSVRRFPARSGRQALYGLLGKLLEDPIEKDNQAATLGLAEGIEALIRTQRRRGMRIVVSDFQSPGDQVLDASIPPDWERPLRRLAVRNQVLCIEVMDAGEVEFPDVGELLIRDPETDFARYVNTSDARARQMIDGASAAQRTRVAAAMRRAGVGHIRLQTDRDWVADIARFVLTYRRTAAVLHTPPPGVSK